MSWTRSRENKELETQLTNQQDARTLLFTPYGDGTAKGRKFHDKFIAVALDRGSVLYGAAAVPRRKGMGVPS
jgi:hypothetical protein